MNSNTFPPYRLPTKADVIAFGWISKRDLATLIYPGTSVDTALPQQWVNHYRARGVDVRPGWVWAYIDGELPLGSPMPLYREALEDVCSIDAFYESHIEQLLADLREGTQP